MTRVIAAPMLMPMITMLIQLASCCCTDLEHHIVVEALADASAHKLRQIVVYVIPCSVPF